MFIIDKFISDFVTKRPVSMFAADIEANKDTLSNEIKDKPIQQEGEIKNLTDSLVDYLNGTEAQAVEQYNQNTMNALHEGEE